MDCPTCGTPGYTPKTLTEAQLIQSDLDRGEQAAKMVSQRILRAVSKALEELILEDS